MRKDPATGKLFINVLELSKPFVGPNPVSLDEESKYETLLKADKIITVEEVSENLTATSKNLQAYEDAEELNATGFLTNHNDIIVNPVYKQANTSLNRVVFSS